MQIHQSTASSGVTAAAQQDKPSSSAKLEPGTEKAFACFHPETAGALVSLESHEDVFFDARSSLSSIDAADLPDPNSAQYQLHSLRTLLPDLMNSIAALRDSSARYIKTMAKQMVDNGAGATANIEAKKTLAQEHDCRLAYPFHQRIFLFDKTIDDREFHADYARAGGHGDACLGLSMNWCQSRAKGQSDEIFFHKLADYRGDALLPRVLGFQHIEQRAFKDKTDNAERMLRETLPKLGMTLERSPGSAPPAHRAVMLNDLAPYLNAVLQPGKNQTLLLLSEHHAMALHQDTQGSLHFFDPLFGVVQADSIERLSRFLSDVFNRDAGSYWSKADRRLQISQVGAGPDFQLR